MSKQHVPAPITLNEMIDGVKNSISSVFTKSDVLDILNRIDVKVTEVAITESEMEELINHVRNSLGYINSDDIIDSDSVELELNGNVIEVKSIDVDTSFIEDEVEDAIRHWFDHNVF